MKLNHITFVVSDIKESIKFYKDILWFECPFAENIYWPEFSKVTWKEELNLDFAVLKMPNTNVILELAQFNNPKQEINKDFRHIAFEIDDVDIFYDKLLSKWIETVSEPVTVDNFHPKIDWKRFFYFKDPDGNMIEVFNSKKWLYSNN